MGVTDHTRVNLPVRPANVIAGAYLDEQIGSPTPVSSVRPPEDAPNVLAILVDDMGFGASSAFGGPCEMPVAERLAEGGLRYTRFHTTSICSPTRAALLTGRNHHSIGFGWFGGSDWPGYNWHRPACAATIARTLACNGYATSAFGKWHQTPPREGPAGPFDQWPTGEGFEKFYGFNGGYANHWSPQLFDGTTRLDPPRTRVEGYHLSEDLVDQAIQWIRDVRTLRPESRFFTYLSFGSTHWPLHAPREWVEKYQGRFDCGWDAQREMTLVKQRELGVIPGDTVLAPRPEGLPLWDDLHGDEQHASSVLMELYAGFAEHMDAQVGRLVDVLEQDGVLDDTMIVYILGDNGASAETVGNDYGELNMLAALNGRSATAQEVLAHVEELGGPATYPQFSMAWAFALNTPYQWWKHVASHYGGTRNGLIVHWPGGIDTRGGIRNQWHHVIDIAPTILEAAGLPQPAVVDGVEQTPMEGTAMNYSFDDEEASDRHTTQYFEIAGNRGIYHEGWVACTVHRPTPLHAEPRFPSLREDVWELYDTNRDWSQAQDIAAEHPDRLAELQEMFLIEAARHNVLPLDGRSSWERIEQQARVVSLRSRTFHARTRAFPTSALPNITMAAHTVTARVKVPETGVAGVICAHGGRFGGWALYFKDGRLTYCHNNGATPISYIRAKEPIARGVHKLQYRLLCLRSDAKGGTGLLLVDDVEVARGRIQPAVLLWLDEGFDVGVDLYTPVCDEIAAQDNAFTGDIEWVRLDVDHELEIDLAARERLQLAVE